MELITLIIIINGVFILGGGLLIFLVRYKDIMSFFFPQNWNSITMLEKDNNVSNWIQKKSKDLTFKFNNGIYNMFSYEEELEQKDKDKPPIIKRIETPMYRNGRLGHFLYIEGQKNPINFREIKPTGYPEIDEQQSKIDMSLLWTSKNDFMAKYGFIILIVIGIAVLIILLKVIFPNTPTPTPPTK